MSSQNESGTISWWDWIKRAFFILIILQMVPVIFGSIRLGIGGLLNPKAEVALVDLRGMIIESRRLVKDIRSFSEKENIKAMLVRVDSPGGAPGASEILFSELRRVGLKKPVVVLVENVCASGAYYVASAANHIIAPATSLVGSVGVVAMVPNVKGLADDWKITVKTVQSGDFKAVGNPFGDPMTEEEQEYRQKMADDVYEQFVSDVACSRGLRVTEHKNWADGKVFTGRQAIKLGLVDQIGDMTDAQEEIKRRAKIDGDITLVKAPQPSFLTKIFGGGEDDSVGQSMSSVASSIAYDTLYKIASHLQVPKVF